MKRRNFFQRLAAGLIAAPVIKKVIEEESGYYGYGCKYPLSSN